uniref:Ig-like domain-containing protein n=1 Tax=Cyprinus carpio carpio TaxID=630221 RepID=A0A9J8D0K5_CYPCA
MISDPEEADIIQITVNSERFRQTAEGLESMQLSIAKDRPEAIHLTLFCKGMKTVSVMEGDSVTLQTNVTEIQKEDLLMWKFGAEKSLIAEINAEARRFNTYDVPDERFRDRLQLDHQTGSLTITNIRTEHAGHYEVIISGKTVTEYRFSVMVYGTAHVNPVLISTVATGSLLTIAVVWIFCICKRLRKTAEEGKLPIVDTVVNKK